jgi:acyl-CoA synthetase (AMP-forming)/AMP-acid ligase II
MNLACLLSNAARSFPERPAVSIGDRPLYDYLPYGALAAALSAAFRARLGLRPDDRVALAMSNNPEYLAILFAIWGAGLIAVPMNGKLHARELAYIVEDCGARLCLATADVAGPLAEELTATARLIVLGEKDWRDLIAAEPVDVVDRRPEDLAWIFYTSGTTGKPKGAMLSHRNLMTMAVGYLADIDFLSPEDHLFHLAAQSHATGLFGLTHIAKATHQVLPSSGGSTQPKLRICSRYTGRRPCSRRRPVCAASSVILQSRARTSTPSEPSCSAPPRFMRLTSRRVTKSSGRGSGTGTGRAKALAPSRRCRRRCSRRPSRRETSRSWSPSGSHERGLRSRSSTAKIALSRQARSARSSCAEIR